MGHLFTRMLFLTACCFSATGHAIADPLSDAQNAYASGNYAKAFEMYTPLARKGDAKAQLSLGVMYYIGQGVTQSHKDAAKWFTFAGKQGNVLAQNIMGEMHDQGLGVPQDYTTAAKWYRLAAEQGDARGQYNLGIMYERELGVPQDYVKAYMWMSLSKAPVEELNSISKQMTPHQITKSNELAVQCTANNFKGC